jgi:hypothetical protein
VFSGTANVTGLATTGNLNTTTANATTSIYVGANVFANVTTISVGNSTIYSNITSSVIATTGTLSVTGLATTGNLNTTTANSTTSVNIGANVNLTTTRFNLGNSTVNTFITATAVGTDGTLTIGGNAVFEGALNQFAGNNNFDSGVLFVDATNNRVGVNNTSPDASLTVTGTANVSGAVRVDGLSTLAGNMNAPTGNASVAFNVGANVNLTTARINVGNSTVNTFVSSTTLETDGTVVVGPGSVYRSSNTASTSSITQTVVDSFPKTEGNFARYVVGIKDAGATVVHTIELMAIHDGTTVSLSKYGEIFNSVSLGTFDAAINTANVELKFTAANTTPFTIKTSRVHM